MSGLGLAVEKTAGLGLLQKSVERPAATAAGTAR